MNIAIIPARGGSKRIPRKNIKEFFGKPIIAWSILAALKSNLFDHIIVSTDDEEISEIARKYGASTPFNRPNALSDDKTETIAVVSHAVKWITDNLKKPDYVCCIYATAPFISAEDIKSGFTQIKKGNNSFVFSATEYNFPIQRAFKINPNESLEMFDKKYFSSRSQDLEHAYHDAGQFYWGTSDAWTSNPIIFGEKSSIINIPKYRVQDIDTLDDWINAELMFGALLK